MSKQSQKHPLWLPRLAGYTSPLTTFILLTLWFRPQNEIGWVAVLSGVSLALMVSLATLLQARNEAHRKSARPHDAETISIMQPSYQPETVFRGPSGGMYSYQQSMKTFLETQH